MTDRSEDWFNRAARDLEQAQLSQKSDHHEWACFASQQAAEKAVKALHLFLKQEAWGYVVARQWTSERCSVRALWSPAE